jgi:Hg(II)-responsive transcriptional regulator
VALTIGQVAKAAHVNVETIRYYEREGLIPSPPRTSAGYRQYTEDAIRRVRFMKRAQRLGFTLEEVGILLRLRVRRGSACHDVVAEATKAMERIDGKIDELHRMREALATLVDGCRDRRALRGCPILDALEGTNA